MNTKISGSVVYIGVDDKYVQLFESQYKVENGVSYNSYLINDDRPVIMDTVDSRETYRWLENLENALGDRKPEYLVLQHIEPDHSGSLIAVAEKYLDMKIVGNAKTLQMISQFYDYDFGKRLVTVKDSDTIRTGDHTLQFLFAPMVHWPEVMVTYDSADKVLYTADAFGKFGTLDIQDDWDAEARRYYFNILGKYGAQVQSLLKKIAAANLDINTIAPLHGPVLNSQLERYISKYNVWSSYEAEEKGVTIAVASIHGNTMAAANKIADTLKAKGVQNINVIDLAHTDLSEAVSSAFRYDRLVLAAASFDGGVFTPMEDFLNRLVGKGYKKRKIAIVENTSFAPCAARTMKAAVEKMKDITLCDTVVSFKSTLKDSDMPNVEKLAAELEIERKE